MTIKAERVAAKIEELRAGLAAQQQEAAERASERLAAEDIEQVRNDAQKWALAQEPLRELEELRHELAVAREKVESLWLQREQQRATINGLHAELEAAQEAAAVARAENEELRDIVHATAVGDEVVAGMAGMMVNDLISLSLRQGEEIQELRARLQTMTDIAKSESVSEERLRGVIRDAAGKLEGALHSSRMLADDVVEVVRQLREVLR
jgi:hypothetical protein